MPFRQKYYKQAENVVVKNGLIFALMKVTLPNPSLCSSANAAESGSMLFQSTRFVDLSKERFFPSIVGGLKKKVVPLWAVYI